MAETIYTRDALKKTLDELKKDNLKLTFGVETEAMLEVDAAHSSDHVLAELMQSTFERYRANKSEIDKYLYDNPDGHHHGKFMLKNMEKKKRLKPEDITDFIHDIKAPECYGVMMPFIERPNGHGAGVMHREGWDKLYTPYNLDQQARLMCFMINMFADCIEQKVPLSKGYIEIGSEVDEHNQFTGMHVEFSTPPGSAFAVGRNTVELDQLISQNAERCGYTSADFFYHGRCDKHVSMSVQHKSSGVFGREKDLFNIKRRLYDGEPAVSNHMHNIARHFAGLLSDNTFKVHHMGPNKSPEYGSELWVGTNHKHGLHIRQKTFQDQKQNRLETTVPVAYGDVLSTMLLWAEAVRLENLVDDKGRVKPTHDVKGPEREMTGDYFVTEPAFCTHHQVEGLMTRRFHSDRLWDEDAKLMMDPEGDRQFLLSKAIPTGTKYRTAVGSVIPASHYHGPELSERDRAG